VSVKLGPNVKKLWAIRMANEAIPKSGGLIDGLKFLSSKESIAAGARSASAWTEAAIQAIRLAGEPNPWKNADDEEIAGELLRIIAEKERSA